MEYPNKNLPDHLPFIELINHSNDGVHIINEKGRFVYVNDIVCTRFGITKEEFLKTDIWEIEAIFEKNPAKWLEHVSHLKEYKSMILGGKHITPNGDEITVEVSIKYVEWNNEGYVVAFTRDISERYEIEKKLKDQHEKIQTLAQLPEEDPNPIFRFNTVGEVLYYNKAGKGKLFQHFSEDTKINNEVLKAFKQNRLYKSETIINDEYYSYNIVPIVKENYINLYAKNITVLKHAENELVKLSTVASKTDNGVIITDAEGKIEWVNESFLNISGYEFEEVIEKKPGSFLQGPKTSKKSIEEFRKGLASKKPFNVEILNYNKRGIAYWCSCNITPIFNDENEVTKFISLQLNITQRKEQENEFSELYSRMNILMGSLQDGVLIEDEKRKITLINQSCCNMFGIPAKPFDLLGADCNEAINQLKPIFHNPDMYVERIMELLANKETVLGEEVKMKDGRILERDYIPIFMGKNYKGHLWRYKDITDRKYAEQALHLQKNVLEINLKQQKILSEISFELNRYDISFERKMEITISRLGKFLNISRVYIFENDFEKGFTSNTFEWCNTDIIPQIDNLQQIPIQDIKSFFDVIEKEGKFLSSDIKKLPQELREILEPQGILSILIYPIWLNGNLIGHIGFDECIDENREWTNNIAELLRTVSYMLSFEYDRKQFNENLINSQREALEAAKAKEHFLANMSHEIRTPMNAIIGMAGLLKETTLSQKQISFLNAIKTSADNLLVILNDILDFSKIDAGKLNVENIPFELSEVTAQAIKTQGIKAAEKSLVLNYNYDEQINPVLIGDPFRLNQILLNLLSNAIKFTDRGEVNLSITLLEATQNHNLISIKVKDTGIGIDKNMINKIFDGFIQQDSSITRRFGGTGLGLSITKELVSLFNGEISIESEVGIGSTFTIDINFPVGNEGDLKKEQMVNIDKRVLQDTKVLLVEDNELNQFFALSVLESWGNVVDVANNGKEALEYLDENQYDIVLMDIQMPVMNGLETTKRIRERGYDIPIIALTANALKGDKEKYLAVGMSNYISKPIEPSLLFNAMCEALSIETSMIEEKNLEQDNFAYENFPAYDFERLKVMSFNNTSFIDKMIKVFIETVPESLNVMRKLLEEKDLELLGKQAHKLKSSIDTFSIKPSMEHIRMLEEATQHSIDELIPILHALQRDLDWVITDLQKQTVSN